MDRQVGFSRAIWVNGRRINVTATRRCSRLGSIVSSAGTRRQLGILFQPSVRHSDARQRVPSGDNLALLETPCRLATGRLLDLSENGERGL